MNRVRLERACVCISAVSVVTGLLAMIYAGFTFTGPGERALVQGDSYFVSSLFQLNALGGAVLVGAGILGLVAALRNVAPLAWLGAALAAGAAVVVLVGSGDAETAVGQGNPSNAAVFLIVAVGLAVTQWAVTATTDPARR